MSILNPDLDIPALAATFAIQNRMQVQNILRPDVAQEIDQILRRATPWSLVYNTGESVQRLKPEQLQQIGPGLQQTVQDCIQRAKTQYQFIYYCYPIVDALLAGENPGHPLYKVLEQINSPAMLDFVRRVTGVQDIVKADGQATLYRPGSFLTFHNDFHPQKELRVAYVLGFTQNWKADWGGLLEFYDSWGNVEAGMLPRFNSLSIFTVPQDHAVTYVAPYATEGRYSITGWFRAS